MIVVGSSALIAIFEHESDAATFATGHALAKSLNSPLLFEGNDFAATDVRVTI